MDRTRGIVWALVALSVVTPVLGQEVAYDPTLDARVWLDRGDEPVLRMGEQVRVYYRTSVDAYAAIFRIDTDGQVQLVFPVRPGADSAVRGGRDFRLLFGSGGQWTVREDPGIGNYFMVASPYPLDFSPFVLPGSRDWYLGGVGEGVYEDPYIAIDDYVAALIPGWESEPYALDFIQYSVGDDHDFPRYLCYDCHGFRSYDSWDPYSYACSTYRIVLYDDPYFYPDFRYVGTRAVFARPLPARPRYAVTVRAAGEGWSPLVRRRSAPMLPGGAAQYKEIRAAQAEQRARTAERRTTPADGRPQRSEPTSSTAPRRTSPRLGAQSPARAPERSTVAGPLVKPRSATSAGAAPARRTTRAVPVAGPSSSRSGATPTRRPSAQPTPSGRTAPRSNVRRPSGATTGVGNGVRPSRRVTGPTTSRTPTRAATVPRRVGTSRVTTPRTSRSQPRVTPSTPRTRPTVTPGRRPTSTRATPTRTVRPTPTRARPTSPRATPTRTTRPTTARKPPPRRGGRGGS